MFSIINIIHSCILLNVIILLILTNIENVISNPNELKYSDSESIIESCYNYLEEHLCEGFKYGHKYHFYKPSTDKYSSDQWLWDSGSHMIVWSHRNVTNSVLDMRTMLLMQQENGRIPEEIFWMNRTLKQDASLLLEYSNTKYTDITQMPVLPYSLQAIYKINKSKIILKEFLYPLINYFRWWRNERDVDKDGLVVIIHNWESGLDASPAYDPAFGVYITELNNTAWQKLYPKFWELMETYKFIYKWNITAILNRDIAPNTPIGKLDTWFMVKDVAVNSVYASGWQILSDLAKELNDFEIAKECENEYIKTKNSILTKMWNSKQNHFQTLYIDKDGIEKFSIANTVQNLFPLLIKDLPNENVLNIVNELKDPNKFNVPMGIPTVAVDDPQFEPTFPVDLMWRGPVWGFTNWFLLQGLELHNQNDLKQEIFNKWLNLVQKSGIYEHYNPFTGEPYGPEGLGMSTLICDWIYRYNLTDTK